MRARCRRSTRLISTLAAWMDGEGLGEPKAPVEATQLSGGIQNTIYAIRRATSRRPAHPAPGGAGPAGRGHLREWRIIDALKGTDVPHTEAIALCEDTSVLGRTFYLMGLVDGWSPMNGAGEDGANVWPEPFDADLDACGRAWPTS